MNIDLSIDAKEISIIIKDFIKTYVQNSKCKGIVIGLSGGVDSAVTSILCKQTLGKKNTICLFLPDETTPEKDYKHFKEIVKKFDLSFLERDISNIVKEISNNCLIEPDKYVLANIKARARMINGSLIWDAPRRTASGKSAITQVATSAAAEPNINDTNPQVSKTAKAETVAERSTIKSGRRMVGVRIR